MTKFTLLAAAALVAVSTAASAGANNPTLGESIAAKWDAKTTRDSWNDGKLTAQDEAKAEPKKAKKKWKKKRAAKKTKAAK